MIIIEQLNLKIPHKTEDIRKKIIRLLNLKKDQIFDFEIRKRSVDARKKPELYYSYVVGVTLKPSNGRPQTDLETTLIKRLKNSKIHPGNDVEFSFTGYLNVNKTEAETDKTHSLENNSGKPQVNNFIKPQEVNDYSISNLNKNQLSHEPIVIIGAGPAGLFCGLYLARAGLNPIILDRGADVDTRQKKVMAYWKEGALDPECNVSFGEGGAGTFSDGKLNTQVKDRDGRLKAVLKTLVEFGGDPSIMYEALPHLGTDVLGRVVKNIRNEIIRLGGQVHFNSKVTELVIDDNSALENKVTGVVIDDETLIKTQKVILATGHSARDTFEMLYNKNIPMEAKDFAVGFRVSHPQELINLARYGIKDPSKLCNDLDAAPYKLTARSQKGIGVYSFCMCPGGFVVDASTEPGRYCVNGMSYSKRDSGSANSAIIMTVSRQNYISFVKNQETFKPKGYSYNDGFEGIGDNLKIIDNRNLEGSILDESVLDESILEKSIITDEAMGSTIHPLSGLYFQRLIEERAFKASMGGGIPIMSYGDFKRQINSPVTKMDPGSDLNPDSIFEPSIKGRYKYCDITGILPPELNIAFIEGMESFASQIKGFNDDKTLIAGVESRTSSPVRITRGDDLMSSVKGLYPCGEGAGYAGGITSAAMDGLKVAAEIVKGIRTQY